MNLSKPFQKPGAATIALALTFLFTQMKCAAWPLLQQEQQQSQSQQQTPPPPTPPENAQPASQPTPPAVKQKKVWTEEDVISLRTPADNYQVEKEAKEAAVKEAALRAAANPRKQPTLDSKLPATAEETEKMLKETQQYIQEETDALDKLHKDLLDAPTEQQAQKQEEIDRVNRLLEASQRDLKALQEHLQTFHEKPQGEAPPVAPQPPPPGS
ncbi:MAG TPA: hypothetical protein VN087_08975 [Verrucomicrobiae bacterium]|jgi:hypothetical protein|nr:hypothetical protein [Verrucomicrobiae bacterium]